MFQGRPRVYPEMTESPAASPSPEPRVRLIPANRRRLIAQAILEREVVSTLELARHAGVSPVTVRRDLLALERLGILERTRGGAKLLARPLEAEELFAAREQTSAGAKRAIGEAAAALVRDGESAGMNDGSTVMQVARHLVAADREVFVATNAINVALALLEGKRIEVTVIGGLLRRTSFGTVWPTEALMGALQFDTAILGVDSMNPESGMAMHHFLDAAVAERMMRQAARVIVVADGSKWARRGRAKLADWQAVDVLVTDECERGLHRQFEERGVEVVVAG